MAVYTSIDNPEAYFQVKLWTGNSTNDRAITFDNTDADLDPDLIWIKKRTDDVEDWAVHDTVRGISASAILFNLNSDAAEETHGNNGFVSAVTADTFTLSTNDASGSDGYQYNNNSGDTYVAWCWKETADAGFDIVTYTGNGSLRTISHSLSAVPKMMLIKKRNGSDNGQVYHVSTGNTHVGEISITNAPFDEANRWNDTTPTSSVFTVNTAGQVNNNTSTFVAYLWADKQGFSKFGKYTGNGNADGAFVFLGFRPAFILIKEIDNADNWAIFDNKRSGYNSENERLYPNLTSVEEDGSSKIDFLSNGFKLRDTWGSSNTSGETFLYMAFAEQPFVNSNGVPCNAR